VSVVAPSPLPAGVECRVCGGVCDSAVDALACARGDERVEMDRLAHVEDWDVPLGHDGPGEREGLR
jgi:hypothetical protein